MRTAWDPRTVVLGRRVLTPTGRLLTLREGASLDSPALQPRLLDAGAVHPAPDPLPLDDVTVVVPVRDRPEELARCLAALGDVDVLVVDDGSAVPAVAPRVVSRPNGGPAAARNTAIPLLDRDFVAFVDSDVTVTPAQLQRLRGHFADPSVVAVAPRVVGDLRSPLDLGRHPASVRPGTAVAYVPTACLLVRRSALTALMRGRSVGSGRAPGAYGASPHGVFDEELRYGEDVDLVWRLVAAGGVVRYDPTVVVTHAEPARLRDRLVRRYRYGTSAAPLAQRHPGHLAHLVLPPWPTAVLVLLRLCPPAGVVAAIALAARHHRQVRDPLLAARITGRGLLRTAVGIGRCAALAGPLAWSRPALVALPLLADWQDRRTGDPVRFVAVALLDEAAYGAGVVAGCARHRTLAPLVPRAGTAARTPNP